MKKLLNLVLVYIMVLILSNVCVDVNAKMLYKLDENSLTALKIAEEGTVLLKNDYDVLPLKNTDNVAAMGNALNPVYGGGGSGWVRASATISYDKGLKTAYENGLVAGYEYLGTNAVYDEECNKAIYFISRSTTEGEDNSLSSYYLSLNEQNDILDLCAYYGNDNLIVVLNVGTVIDTSWLIDLDVAGIVLAYLGGEQAGNALANILTGVTNPSGKTVDTWASDYEFYPSSNNFGNNGNSFYEEDIFVGYRYFSTFDPDYETVNYCFGHGLSYTSFDIKMKEYKINDRTISVDVCVKNTGLVEGKEVVQLYMSAPQGKLGKASRELVGFEKTDLIKPNEEQIVTIEFDLDDFASFDDRNLICNNSFVLENGSYKFYLGNSIKNADEIFKYELSEDVIISTSNAYFAPTKLRQILLADGSYLTLNDEQSNQGNYLPSGGGIVVQAENHIDLSEGSTTETYYLGIDKGVGIGNLNIAGRYIEFEVYAQSSGEYNVGFNMASAWDGQNHMFNMYVNDVKQNVSVSMNKTHTDTDGKWFNCIYLSNNSCKITLEEGYNTIKMVGNGTNFMNIDNFVIYSNNILATEKTIIEAETFSSSNVGSVSFADGSGLGKFTTSDQYAEYKMNVLEEGDYYIILNASNIYNADKEALSLFINNEKIGNFSLTRTATHSEVMLESNYYKFRESSPIKLHLEKGEAVIRIQSNGCNVSVVDNILVIPASTYDSSYEFVDNTLDYEVNTNMEGVVLDELITFYDLLEDESLMDSFLSQLSIDELVKLLGIDMSQNSAQTGVGGMGGLTINSKYQIPSINAADGPAGIRYTNSYCATWFPCMTMLSSTWNKELAYEFGQAVGAEARFGNIQLWLAPGLNIHRNPLCGRNFEYMSEDPLVTGFMGTQITKGAQGLGVSVCIKHFAANSQETNRFSNDSQASQRALREIYLKGFEMTIKEANPYALMTCYNQVNGDYLASNKDIMTTLVYEEWGFDGCAVTDWEAWMSHTSLVLSGHSVKSKNPNYPELIASYQNNIITREQIEDVCEKSLKLILRTIDNRKTIVISSNEKMVGDYANSFNLEKNLLVSSISDEKCTLTYRLSVVDDGVYEIELTESLINCEFYINGEKLEIIDNKITLEIEDGLYKLQIITEGDLSDDVVVSYIKPLENPDDIIDQNQPVFDYKQIIIYCVVGIVVVSIGLGLMLFFKKKKSK